MIVSPRERVPDRYEIAARMRIIEGRTWNDIAARLGMSPSVLKRTRHKVFQKFEAALQISKLVSNPGKYVLILKTEYERLHRKRT